MDKLNIKIFREIQNRYGLERLKDFVLDANEYLFGKNELPKTFEETEYEINYQKAKNDLIRSRKKFVK